MQTVQTNICFFLQLVCGRHASQGSLVVPALGRGRWAGVGLRGGALGRVPGWVVRVEWHGLVLGCDVGRGCGVWCGGGWYCALWGEGRWGVWSVVYR